MATGDLAEKLRAAEWPKLLKQLTEYARRRTTRIEDAEDVAQTAIKRVFDPRYVDWDPAKEPLLKHLVSVVNGVLVNNRRKRTSRELGHDPEVLAAMHTHTNHAESRLMTEEAKARAFAALRESVAGDELASAMVELDLLGISTPREQQARLMDVPMERIRSARRRIHAHAEKIAQRLGEDDE